MDQRRRYLKEVSVPLRSKWVFLLFMLIPALLLPGAPGASSATAAGKKVLVVMSYHPEHRWQHNIKEGIDSVLKDADLRYFWLDTKRDLAGGEARAREAFDLYRNLNPDAVIVADDNAQPLFVVPYLKDKVKTPVVFCGVNDDAAKYGFPASNVTGIIEKKHNRESIGLVQQVDPGIRRIAVIYKDSPSNRINLEQIRKEKHSYSAELVEFIEVRTLAEAVEAVNGGESPADAFLSLSLSGILDAKGVPLDWKDALPAIVKKADKPIIAVGAWQVEAGALCGVVKTGQEQGRVAARMVLDLLGGRPIEEVPITENRNGHRIINVTTAKRLGIDIPAAALLEAELVK